MNRFDPAQETSQPGARRHPPLDSVEFQTLLEQLREEFALSAAEYDRSCAFPHANFARLHEYDLLSLTVPKRLGGGGASLYQAMKVVSAIAQGEPSTALVLVMQYQLHFQLQSRSHWPVALREHVAHQAITEGALINTLRAEPALGTPGRGGLPGMIASRTTAGWVINGSKLYATGSPGLAWLTVWARSDETPARVGVWLVHRDTPGVSVGQEWNHLGMRATGSHELVFKDVEVPAEYAVDVHPQGVLGAGLDAYGVAWMNVLISAVYDGVARAARGWFVQWALARAPANLGAPLASLPTFQQTLGKIDALLLSNRVLLDAAAHGASATPPQAASTQATSTHELSTQGATTALAEAPLVKYLVTNQAIEAVQIAVEASGNPGLSRDNALERHYRDVLCARIHTPQNDTVLLNAGRSGFADPTSIR